MASWAWSHVAPTGEQGVNGDNGSTKRVPGPLLGGIVQGQREMFSFAASLSIPIRGFLKNSGSRYAAPDSQYPCQGNRCHKPALADKGKYTTDELSVKSSLTSPPHGKYFLVMESSTPQRFLSTCIRPHCLPEMRNLETKEAYCYLYPTNAAP